MENKSLKITVTESFDQCRLDKFLHESEITASRNRASQLIEMGLVTVNKRSIKKSSYKVRTNDLIETTVPSIPDESQLQPYDFDLNIIYDDEDLLVVNKPSGLVVHPAAGHAQDTLVNALIHHVDNLSMGFGEKRPGIVHRIDKDTSGLLVVAKNDKTQEALAQQFKEKSVHRVYKAIVYGHPKENSGTIQSYLIRHPIDRKRFCSERVSDLSTPKGKNAITHFQVEKNYPSGLSLISCRLETGRTHQIRVHMFEKQHGIVGDPIYSSTGRLKNLKSSKLRSVIKKMNRIALHAEQLGFIHPRSGKRVDFQAGWPEDMNEIFNFLKKYEDE